MKNVLNRYFVQKFPNKLCYKKVRIVKGIVTIDDEEPKNIIDVLGYNCITFKESNHLKCNLYYPIDEDLLIKIINEVLEDYIDGYFNVDFDTLEYELINQIPVCCTNTLKWFYENCTPLEYEKIMNEAKEMAKEG